MKALRELIKAGKKLRWTRHASARRGEIRKWPTVKQSHLSSMLRPQDVNSVATADHPMDQYGNEPALADVRSDPVTLVR
jgi:hypothetical protein